MRTELNRRNVEQMRLASRALRGEIIEVDTNNPGLSDKPPLLTEYLCIVLSRRWLALAIVVVCLLSSAILLATRTPMYRASRRVLIRPMMPHILPSIERVYEDGVRSGSMESFLNTQYKLLLSPRVLENTLADPALGLSERAQFQQQDRLEEFAKYFEISPVRLTWLVDVSFTWPDPQKAAQVVNALVDNYIEDHNHRRLGVTRPGLDALRLEAKKLKPAADKAMRAKHEFMKNHNMASLDQDKNIKIQQYSDISRKVTELGSERSRLESRMESIQSALKHEGASAYLPELVNNETTRQLKLSLIKRQEEYSDLLSRLGLSHDAVITIVNRIKTIEEKMRAEARAILAAAQAELDRIVQQEKDHKEKLNILDAEMIEYSGMKWQYDLLCEEAKTKSEMANEVEKRVREIELSLATGSSEKNIFPLGEASVPVKRHSPRKMVYAFAGLFIGLVLAVGACFLLDYLDTTVKTREDVEQLLGLPVLGYMPALEGGTRQGKELEQTDRSRDFMALDEPHSAVAESFRSIRTSLSLSGNGQEGTKLIAVTSASPKEGKSIVTINLALALARAGKKVLLMDADMRKPRQHKAFQMNPQPGLSNLLAGHSDVPLALAIRPTQIANLSLLPSGPIPPNPAELLGSPLFGELLSSLPADLDYVILDTPPAANVTDAVIISERVHRTILVVRCFRVEKHLLRRTAELLQMVQGSAESVIINNVDMPRGVYGYYDSYYYQQYRYYYYGDGESRRRKKKQKRRSRRGQVVAEAKESKASKEKVGANS